MSALMQDAGVYSESYAGDAGQALQPGEDVVIFGLKNSTQYNGKSGKVLKTVKRGKLAVKLPNQKKIISIAPSNVFSRTININFLCRYGIDMTGAYMKWGLLERGWESFDEFILFIKQGPSAFHTFGKKKQGGVVDLGVVAAIAYRCMIISVGPVGDRELSRVQFAEAKGDGGLPNYAATTAGSSPTAKSAMVTVTNEEKQVRRTGLLIDDFKTFVAETAGSTGFTRKELMSVFLVTNLGNMCSLCCEAMEAALRMLWDQNIDVSWEGSVLPRRCERRSLSLLPANPEKVVLIQFPEGYSETSPRDTNDDGLCSPSQYESERNSSTPFLTRPFHHEVVRVGGEVIVDLTPQFTDARFFTKLANKSLWPFHITNQREDYASPGTVLRGDPRTLSSGNIYRLATQLSPMAMRSIGASMDVHVRKKKKHQRH